MIFQSKEFGWSIVSLPPLIFWYFSFSSLQSAVKSNALTKLRQIFTQEIFTEQVIFSCVLFIQMINFYIFGWEKVLIPIVSSKMICKIIENFESDQYLIPSLQLFLLMDEWIFKNLFQITASDGEASILKFVECGLFFRCHYSQVHSDLEW